MENQDNIQNLVQDSTKLSFFKSMSKGNFIFFVVSYAIIGIMILTTILLAVIPTSTGVKFENAPDYITISSSSASLTLYADDDNTKDDYKAVWDAYNGAGSPTVIDAMFNGCASKGKEAVYNSKSLSYSTSTLTADGAYAVYFYWKDDNAQEMTNASGDTFTYFTTNNVEITTPTYYTAAAFSVSDSNTITQNTIYLRKKDTTSSTRYLYKGYANFLNLYELIEQFDNAGKFTS